MNALVVRLQHAVLLALLVALGAPVAWAQTPPPPPPTTPPASTSAPASVESALKNKASASPRFLYVAAPANLANNAMSADQHFRGGYHPGEHPLTPDSREVDFFTIDAELLGKRPVPDASDPELLRVQGRIPAHAIVAVTHFYQDPATQRLEADTRLNPAYARRLPEGKYPRVRYTGDVHGGTHFTEEAGVTGPKLILNEDMRGLEALSTHPDELVVVVHANPYALSYSDANGHQTMLSSRQLAGMIRSEIARRGLPRNTTVRLFGCEAGRRFPGERGIAEQLADDLVTPDNPDGNAVIAPTGVSFMYFRTVSGARGPELIALPPAISPPRSAPANGRPLPRWQVFRSTRARTDLASRAGGASAPAHDPSTTQGAAPTEAPDATMDIAPTPVQHVELPDTANRGDPNQMRLGVAGAGRGRLFNPAARNRGGANTRAGASRPLRPLPMRPTARNALGSRH